MKLTALAVVAGALWLATTTAFQQSVPSERLIILGCWLAVALIGRAILRALFRPRKRKQRRSARFDYAPPSQGGRRRARQG